MRSPHVKELRYRLVMRDDYHYEAPAVQHEAAGFRARLEGETLRIEMKEHFATEEEAKTLVQPFVRAWEISAALDLGLGALGFSFEGSEILDRDPEPGIINVHDVVHIHLLESAKISIVSMKYPDPPPDFAALLDVEVLWFHFEGYFAGRVPLLSMAYTILTIVERIGGGRKGAASKFNIANTVLDKLGHLCSKGDERTARKFPGPHQRLKPLLPTEEEWIKAVVKKIIRRVGSTAATRHQITMSDLPKLW